MAPPPTSAHDHAHVTVLLKAQNGRLLVLYCFDCMYPVAYSPRADVLGIVQGLHHGAQQRA